MKLNRNIYGLGVMWEPVHICNRDDARMGEESYTVLSFKVVLLFVLIRFYIQTSPRTFTHDLDQP